MPSVVGEMTKGAVFDKIVDVAAVGGFDSLAEKSSPVSADLLVVADSADSFARKKLQVGNVGVSESLAIVYAIALG